MFRVVFTVQSFVPNPVLKINCFLNLLKSILHNAHEIINDTSRTTLFHSNFDSFHSQTHLKFSKSQISHNKIKFGEGIEKRIQEFKKMNTPENYF